MLKIRVQATGEGKDFRSGLPSLRRSASRLKDDRAPYVDGPLLARDRTRNDQIACAHMSGLLSRSYDRCQDGFRDASS